MLATWGASRGFNPASLFSGGEQGAWYDPSNVNLTWRRNLLTYSEQIDNAAWTKLQTTVATNQIVAPDGTTTADLISSTAVSSRHTVTNVQAGAVGGAEFTVSVFLKKGSQRYIVFGDSGDSVWRLITIDTDTFTVSGSTNITTSSITDVGNGWYRVIVTYTRTNSGNLHPFFGFSNIANATVPPTYVGDAADNFYVWGAQIEQASTASAYQQIVTPEITYVATVQPQPVLWQNQTGLTPVTAIEQPVGMIFDTKAGIPARRYNLLTYTEQFDNAAWNTNATAITRTANTTTAPDGTLTADSATGDGTNATHYFGQTISLSSTVTYRLSFYAKANGVNFVQVALVGGTGFANFDITTGAGAVGTVGSPFSSPTIEDAGNGWYRCSVVLTNPTFGNIYFILSNSASAARAVAFSTSAGIFLWGAQLLTADDATSTGNAYQRIASGIGGEWTIGNNAYQATDASRPTLRARYNLLTYSEQIDNAFWTKSNLNITGTPAWVNAGVAPDGTTTAEKLIADATNTLHSITSTNFTTLATTSYTVSAFLKSNNVQFAYLQVSTAPFGVQTRAWFDLTNGTLGTQQNCVATITSVGNGWYRCSFTATSTVGSASTALVIALADVNGGGAFLGDGTNGILCWGVQILTGADNTSTGGAYQRIAAATDYVTVSTMGGAVFRPYLAFDGTDDSLLTQSINFPIVTSDGQTRRNLLLSPNLLDDANWTRTNVTVTGNTTVAPDGTTTADTILATAGAATHRVSNSTATSLTAGAIVTGSAYIKAGTAPFAAVALSATTTSAWAAVVINMSTGAITQTTNGASASSVSSSIQDVGNGWYRVTVTAILSTDTSGALQVHALDTGTPTFGNYAVYSWTAVGTETVIAWGSQLEAGTTATAFQNIGTQQMSVWSGLTKLSDAATAIITELSANSATTAGTFGFTASASAGVGDDYWSTAGTTRVAITSTITAPRTLVYTGIGDIGAPNAVMRRNGVQVANSTSTQGTGNYGNHALFIGRRNNATLPFNGRIYQLIVRGAASNASQISGTEQYVAGKTGVAL